MSGITATATLNANRDPKEHPKPHMLPMPWSDKKPEEQVTDQERALLKSVLERHSAFAQPAP
jgi:hypothetical protein